MIMEIHNKGVIFLNIEFRHPTLADRDWINELYRRSGCRASECSFVNLYLWGRGYGEIARIGDFVVQFIHYGGTKYYAYPAGSGDLRPVLEALAEDARAYGHPMRLLGVTRERREQLESLCPGAFRFEDNRDAYDYLYEIDRLATLSGKKLQSKRNHCNRFAENHPDWQAVALTPDNLGECRDMAAEWFSQYDGETSEAHDFRVEKVALERAFDGFASLGLEGLMLKEGDTVLAFTIGNIIQPDTFDVNFEKAYHDDQGAYPTINREFARRVQAAHPEIRYLNREDDMGLPGLRKAKESYHPDILLEKSVAYLEGPL